MKPHYKFILLVCIRAAQSLRTPDFNHEVLGGSIRNKDIAGKGGAQPAGMSSVVDLPPDIGPDDPELFQTITSDGTLEVVELPRDTWRWMTSMPSENSPSHPEMPPDVSDCGSCCRESEVEELRAERCRAIQDPAGNPGAPSLKCFQTLLSFHLRDTIYSLSSQNTLFFFNLKSQVTRLRVRRRNQNHVQINCTNAVLAGGDASNCLMHHLTKRTSLNSSRTWPARTCAHEMRWPSMKFGSG